MLGKGKQRFDLYILSPTALTAVILIGLGADALGQGLLFRNDVHSMLPVDADRTASIALGDVDGDGDLDAFVGGIPNRLYLNDGNGVFTDATSQIPDAPGRTNSIALGDVDGDGDLDAFIGNGDVRGGGCNYLYLNDGNGVFTDATAQIPADWCNTHAVALGDVDGDGDLDAFLGNYGIVSHNERSREPGLYPQPNSLYLNDGNGVFTDATVQIPADWDFTSAVALGDVDGDGDFDAFIGNGDFAYGENRLYLNDGNGNFSDATAQIPLDSDYTYAVALGDVDGDGDLDAFLGNDDQNHLYLNDGNGVFADATSQIPVDSDYTYAVALGDVDGDGDLDAFLGNASYPGQQNRLYLNDGTGVFTDAASQIAAAEPTYAVALGDVDGDGDLDAFFGIYYDQNRLYLNDGYGVLTDATSQIPADSDETRAVALGDVDGDGDLDAFLGNSDHDQNRLYLNDSYGVFTDATTQIPADSDGTHAVALGDVDGDGDLDVFLGNVGQNRLYLNDSYGVFADTTSQIPVDSDRTWVVALGDVDGDGDLDAFLGNKDSQNRLYLNDGRGIFADTTSQIPVDSDETWVVALGDVDGDGDLDAFLGNRNSQNRLYLNDGNGVFADATGQIPQGGANTVALGDVDGDGDLDAFIGNGGQNRLYLNDGNGVFSDASSQIPVDSDYTYAVALGDVDGDGDLDAFLGNAAWPGEQNRVYLNDGYGVFTDATMQISPDWDRTVAIALGDLDGDGDLDAFAGNEYQSQTYTNLTRQLAWRGVPRIGKPLDLDLYGPADGTYVLAISRRETYRPKPPRGVLRIHPGYVLHTKEGALDSDGHALLTYDLPDDPALVGKSFYWQALVKSPGRFTNLEITTLTDL